jgi:hypothetical protein
MTLREKFDNVEICIESQLLNLRYDENMKCVEECEQIADEFAIGFAKWCMDNNQQVILNDGKYLLEIYKKEKQL